MSALCQEATYVPVATSIDGVYLRTMKFEKVHTIRDIYDGIRTGTADLKGVPHYFASVFDDDQDEYTQHFRLYPLTSQFMERELRRSTTYKAWEARFHRGLEPLDTHPGHGGVVPEYDELTEWLNTQIKALTPLSSFYVGIFRAIPGQEELSAGILRAVEVAWEPVSA
jgi:hypothetical protein